MLECPAYPAIGILSPNMSLLPVKLETMKVAAAYSSTTTVLIVSYSFTLKTMRRAAIVKLQPYCDVA